MKKIVFVITLVLSSTFLFACAEDENTIHVGASPVPHAEILEQIKPILAEQGYTLKITVFNDYVLPNVALVNQDLDANFFQHVPYLNYYNQEHQTNIKNAGGIHIEPIGIYSKRYVTLDELQDGDTVIMSSSVSDQGRMLSLLQNAGLITLNPEVNPFEAVLSDITDNPRNLVFRADIEPSFLIEAYNGDEAALILINTNYALDGGLTPSEDALIIESASTDNPFVNLIAVLESRLDDPKILALVAALQSATIQAWILETYGGNVVPVDLS